MMVDGNLWEAPREWFPRESTLALERKVRKS
jgi:hypothetical protein